MEIFIYSLERHNAGQTYRKRNLSAGSLPNWPCWSRLGQAKVRSLKLIWVSRICVRSICHCLIRSCVGSGGAETWTSTLDTECQLCLVVLTCCATIPTLFLFLFKVYLFIWKAEWQRYWEWQWVREENLFSASLPKQWYRPGLGQVESGAKNSILVSEVDNRDPSIRIICSFPEFWIKSSSVEQLVCAGVPYRPDWVLAAPFPIQLPDHVPGIAAEDGLSDLAPASHLGDQDTAPGSYLWSGSTLVLNGLWGVNQQMRVLFL